MQVHGAILYSKYVLSNTFSQLSSESQINNKADSRLSEKDRDCCISHNHKLQTLVIHLHCSCSGTSVIQRIIQQNATTVKKLSCIYGRFFCHLPFHMQSLALSYLLVGGSINPLQQIFKGRGETDKNTIPCFHWWEH